LGEKPTKQPRRLAGTTGSVVFSGGERGLGFPGQTVREHDSGETPRAGPGTGTRDRSG